MHSLNNDNQRLLLNGVLDMIKNQDIKLQPQIPVQQKQLQRFKENTVTIYELASLMLLGLWLSGNCGNMSWMWIPVPILIPYVVWLGAISFNKIKNFFSVKNK